ncbi:MAG TPA: nitronate monooxygenase [Candidatus Polarisedimenticolaceae bacterium]|nr:nitronate monooxygenase [Candidatus Polarisedimenticolaceae bacterium]
MNLQTAFTRQVGIEVPLICGAMYPCSNAALIAAVSEAGGIGIVQPISLTYVHGHELRAGLREIRARTARPIGFNAIVERSSRIYQDRMRRWVDVAIEEGVRFFVTALGNPRWVVDRVRAVNGVVYHDVTDRRWALKALEQRVDGLICVNRRAGGHTGTRDGRELFEELHDLGVPLICAGGIGDETTFAEAIRLGYAGAQLGTRFIASHECTAHDDYKRAIVEARAEQIVLTDKLSGVPCSVIRTPYVDRVGTRSGRLARWLLRGRRTKHLMRTIYALHSLRRLKHASLRGLSYRDIWQAGKSVETIDRIEPAGEIVRRFRDAIGRADRQPAAAIEPR